MCYLLGFYFVLKVLFVLKESVELCFDVVCGRLVVVGVCVAGTACRGPLVAGSIPRGLGLLHCAPECSVFPPPGSASCVPLCLSFFKGWGCSESPSSISCPFGLCVFCLCCAVLVSFVFGFLCKMGSVPAVGMWVILGGMVGAGYSCPQLGIDSTPARLARHASGRLPRAQDVRTRTSPL